MSFFNSLRRRSMTNGQSKDATYEKSPTSAKRRALTIWSVPARHHKPATLDVEASKSEDGCDFRSDAVEEDLYPKFDPNDPDHKSSASSDEQQPSKPSKKESNLRGRSLSFSKSPPFSTFRRASRSRSRSGSPSRNIFHKAAELIRGPTAFFYKEHTSEDLAMPSVENGSPPKSLRSKKSVRFTSSSDENESTSKSSPIPIPGASAPSLPPVDVSSSDLMTLGIENVATLTARPPPTPIIETQIANAMAIAVNQAITNLPDVSTVATTEGGQYNQKECNNGKDPSSDKTEARLGVDDFFNIGSVEIAETAELDGQNNPQSSTSPIRTKLIEERVVTNLKTVGITCHGSSNSIAASTRLPNTSLEINNTVRSDKSPQTTQDFDIKTGHTDGSKSNSLPLRLKRSVNSFRTSDTGDDVVNQDTLPVGGCVEGSMIVAGDCNNEDDKVLQALQLLRTPSLRQGIEKMKNASEQRVNEELDGCTTKLQSLSIKEKAKEQGGLRERNQESPSKPDLNIIVPLNHSAKTDRSASPTRRRFRFENKADPSSSEHFVVSPSTPNTPRTHQCNQTPIDPKSLEGNLQTPSPSRIPLPPSIHPRKPNTMSCQAHTYRDQHGWSPFSEDQFAKMALEIIVKDNGVNTFVEMICEDGGFECMWEKCSLPSETAPKNNSKAPTQDEAENLVNAIIGWAYHQCSDEPVRKSPHPKYDGAFPVKYFKRRDGSPVRDGFFAPITTVDYNRSSEAFSEDTQNFDRFSVDDTVTQSARSSNDLSAYSSGDQTQNPCYCDPCECSPCLCGAKENELKHDVSGEPPLNRYATTAPVDETPSKGCKTFSRAISANSEPGQHTLLKLPPVGSVPLRYFNKVSAESRTTMASDTSLDDEEAYCAGIV